MTQPKPTSETSATGAAEPPAIPSKRTLRERSPILAHLRSMFLAGLVAAIPLFITLWVLSLLYGIVTHFTELPAGWIVDHFLAPLIPDYVSDATLKVVLSPVLAVLISLLIVYLIGMLSTFFIGRKIIAKVEHFIQNLPLIKGIYGTTKQVIAVFRRDGNGKSFQRVVLVEFPRAGTWTIAFVTNTVTDTATNKHYVCTFIPMTPNPTSGFFQMFPHDQIRDTDWTVDEGIKIILSGGLLAPSELNFGKAPGPGDGQTGPLVERADAEGEVGTEETTAGS